jgi:hypothetical protein
MPDFSLGHTLAERGLRPQAYFIHTILVMERKEVLRVRFPFPH